MLTAAGFVVLVLTGASTARVGASPQAAPAADLRSVWSGVFTDSQAERGSVIYLQSCAKCHGADLLGDSGAERPALVGDEFTRVWDGETVGAMFERISTAMPGDAPGSLMRNAYADLVAYLLRTNGFPAGSNELRPDTAVLARIAVSRVLPQSSGPRPNASPKDP